MKYRVTPTYLVDVPVYICLKVRAEDEDEARDIADEATKMFMNCALKCVDSEEVEDWDFNSNEADNIEMEEPDDFRDGPDWEPEDYEDYPGRS